MRTPPLDLPEHMTELTPAWLQSAVGAHQAFRDTEITGIRASPLGAGIGQMSELARVELAYAREAGPASVVIKLHTPFQAMRDVGVKYEMFARETAFYQDMAREVTVPLPDVYFAGWDAAAQRNAIVMQDMTDWFWPDQLKGPTLQQAERCVDAIAQLGAKHWGGDLDAYPWLPDARSPVLLQSREDYVACSAPALDRCARFLTPEMRRACERITRNIDWVFDAMAEPPHIVTHYDCRLENFVFADESAAKLAMIDWQLIARARPGWDIAYFTGTSLPVAAQAHWQASLRARYCAGLKACGVTGYTEAAANLDFRLATMAMTVIAVIGGATFDESNPRSCELFGEIMRRSMTSVLANDCLTLLPA